MFNLFMILIGSSLVGFGAGSASIGVGVGCIAFGFHLHFNHTVSAMHENLVIQMRKIYQKIG